MSNIFSHQSFSVFTPFSSPLKPYPFPFRNKLILIGRRSRSRKLSSTPPPINAQSSSEDIVLISTTGTFLIP